MQQRRIQRAFSNFFVDEARMSRLRQWAKTNKCEDAVERMQQLYVGEVPLPDEPALFELLRFA